MVKRLLSFLISLAFIAPLAYAQTEDEYADQSEIVTVLNETDANGNYIVGRSEDGYPTVTFRLAKPSGATNFYGHSVFYEEGSGYKKTGYRLLYVNAKNAEETRISLKKNMVIEADDVQYDAGTSFSVLGIKTTVDEVAYRDYTITIKPLSNREYSILTGSEYKITFPTIGVMERTGSNPNYSYSIFKSYAAKTYTFKADGKGPKVLSGTVSTTALSDVQSTDQLYLKAGSVLTVENEFTCKNIYVEAADESNNGLPAGIVINEDGSLIADSVFFMANQYVDYGVGYLINNGACSAGVAFMKGASSSRQLDAAYANAYGYTVTYDGDSRVDNMWFYTPSTFSSPVKSHEGVVDMVYRDVYQNIEGLYASGLWSPFISFEKYSSALGLANVTSWTDYYNEDASIPFYIMHLYDGGLSLSVRACGDINDEDSYELPVTNVAGNGEPSQTFVSNPYPAPVDWRSVVEAAGADFVSDIRDIQQSPYSATVNSIYNFKTGLTTTDAVGKMYYGYLQPNMSHVQLLHNAGNVSDVTFAKSNLSSLQQADEKYAGADITNGLPYVRFYVDDTNESLAKGVGKRSVVAIYFVSKEEFDNLHATDSEDYDAEYDINKVYESLAETHLNSVAGLKKTSGWLFPYVGAYGVNQTSDDVATAIKMVAIPETATEVLNNFIRISIESKKTEGGVEFGILDYDLKTSNLGVQVGGLSLNYPNASNVLATKFDVGKGYAEGETTREFVADKKYCEWDCKQLSLNLTVAKNDETPKSIEENTVASNVYTSGSAIVVSTSEAGVLRVFDLAGRVVAEQAVFAGEVSVAMPAGVYVASFNASGSSCVKSVIVK